jgi:hypothetical protein
MEFGGGSLRSQSLLTSAATIIDDSLDVDGFAEDFVELGVDVSNECGIVILGPGVFDIFGGHAGGETTQFGSEIEEFRDIADGALLTAHGFEGVLGGLKALFVRLPLRFAQLLGTIPPHRRGCGTLIRYFVHRFGFVVHPPPFCTSFVQQMY